MSSSSSTFSSETVVEIAERPTQEVPEREFSKLERARIGRVPWAAIGTVLVIGCVEFVLRSNREWFADSAAWQWQSKSELIESGKLHGDIAVIGTSVLFHSVDPAELNARSRTERRVINLALNGLQLNGQYHLLSRYLDGGNDPEFVLLELSRVDVERERWISGPFWRDWATWPEFLSSRSYSFEPSLAIPFAANRALTSFSYRRALDNWVFACVRSGGLDTSYRDRNRQITSDMDRHLGFSPGSFDRSMTEADIPPGESRPWRQTRAGAIWLEHILDLCDRHGIEVWILQPPVPPFVAQERRRDGFRAGFVALVADLRQRYPRLGLEVLEPTGYELADFADHRHFSPQGSRKLCRDLVPWVDSLTVH